MANMGHKLKCVGKVDCLDIFVGIRDKHAARRTHSADQQTTTPRVCKGLHVCVCVLVAGTHYAALLPVRKERWKEVKKRESGVCLRTA